MNHAKTNAADQLHPIFKRKEQPFLVMMKFLLASDLHLDELKNPIEDCVLHVEQDTDYIILAGDIGERFSHVEWLKNISKIKPVIYVPGNHCYYHDRLTIKEEKLREKLVGYDVTILSNSVIEHDNFVIIGTTLWMDLTLFPSKEKQAKIDYDITMKDRKKIHSRSMRKFYASEVQKEFRKNLSWLEDQLHKYHDKTCIVVTHHAPSILSISASLREKLIAACYASNLDDFIKRHPQIKVWCHGHIHESSDYNIGHCRIICNPYKGMFYHKGWHNPSFSNKLQVRVET